MRQPFPRQRNVSVSLIIATKYYKGKKGIVGVQNFPKILLRVRKTGELLGTTLTPLLYIGTALLRGTGQGEKCRFASLSLILFPDFPKYFDFKYFQYLGETHSKKEQIRTFAEGNFHCSLISQPLPSRQQVQHKTGPVYSFLIPSCKF